jgi:hypothetical protein
MVGLPCLRVHGAFFASCDRRSGDLLVKLPAARVDQLVGSGRAHAFAPAGRRFREWAAVPPERSRSWRQLLDEALAFRGRRPLMAPPRFAFPTETLAFLADLRAYNTKPWFDAHRHRYEAAYLEPAKAFVETIAPALEDLVPGIATEPRVNGSIFRIKRDTRFSKDKTPYKDHLDFWFWAGDRRTALSGLFLRIAPDAVIVGAGAHGFDPPASLATALRWPTQGRAGSSRRPSPASNAEATRSATRPTHEPHAASPPTVTGNVFCATARSTPTPSSPRSSRPTRRSYRRCFATGTPSRRSTPGSSPTCSSRLAHVSRIAVPVAS